MTEFDDPFYRRPSAEQIAALADLARAALPTWELSPDCPIELLAERENTVFTVTAPDGDRYVARVHRAGYHTDAQLRSQVAWARALERDGVIHTASVVYTRGGDPFTHASHPNVPEIRQVSLLRWAPGISLAETGDTDADTLERLGTLMASLHDHADTWPPPPDFELLCWDADGLLGDDPEWGRFWEVPGLAREDGAILSAFRERARTELADLGTNAGFGLVHGDFLPDNILVAGDQLTLLDFDDAGVGWHLFDMATALAIPSLSDDYPSLRDAFVKGYRSRRALADAELSQLPLFLALRGCTYIGWMHTRAHTDYAKQMTELVTAAALTTARNYLES